MIGRKEYTDRASEIIDKLPEHYKKNVTVDAPGPYNFQIALKVKGGRLGCEDIRESLNSIFDRDTVMINQIQVRASIEPSPDRRVKWRIYQANLQALDQLVNPKAYDVDERFLKIFNVEDASIAGEFKKGSAIWEWNEEVLKNMGVDKQKVVDRVSE